ncbi:MAG TPA: CAP domain-containing protein [Opitutus sp.]|nr:CAP domain-containing protein [Opitutus sp.]
MRLIRLIFPLLLGTSAIFAQPTAPTARRVSELRAQTQLRASALPALSVNPASREEARQFYRALYGASDDVPMGWTGSFSTGAAGETSSAFKDAVLLRINFFRALAGVPAAVTLNSTFSAKAQQAALMMSANRALSHNPPSSWTFYTPAGAEAAGNSNLSIGLAGPDAITGYIADPGAGNQMAGHRRWLLYPQTREMGTGDVPETGSNYAANATWILDGNYNSPGPSTRTTYVAWPPAGYVPAPLIFPRWSFSYPGASFANATVTMTRDGAAVPVNIEARASGAGENSLVWSYGNLDTNTSSPPAVTSDSTFHVTVGNVLVNGTPQTFIYDVIAFDPDRPGPDAVTFTVSAVAASTFTVAKPPFVPQVQWRSVTLDPTAPVYDAENSLAGLTARTTGAYSARTTSTVAAGTASYHLATPTADDQFLTGNDILFAPAGSSPQLTLRSRLGFATADQVARIQTSTDEGVSWTDVYRQPGSGGAGETSFVSRTVPLAGLAGRTFRIRFAYTQTRGTSFYPQTEPGVGWFFDDVAFSGVQGVSAASSPTDAAGATFSYSGGASGVQARGVLFGRFPLEWGAVTRIAPRFSLQPASQSAGVGSSVTLTADVTPGSAFQWRRNGVLLAGATGSSYTLGHLQPASTGLYSATALVNGASASSLPAIVGLASAIKVTGDGNEVDRDVRHPNGNIFDQVLATGAAETITSDYALGQITRTSFVDLDDDIVQVEFSGPGSLSLVLEGVSGPAGPLNYNQPGIRYMKGHAGIVITGATEQTHVSVFTVGKANAVNQALFKAGVDYDGVADIAYIAIASANGKFGGVRTANTHYFASSGVTGLYAPGVAFQGPVYLGNVTAFGDAQPMILLGSATDTQIAGGDLYQDNGAPVQVSGLSRLKFTAGSDSHGRHLEAQPNRAVLLQDGLDVTARTVANP